MTDQRSEWISKRAYAIWEAAGRPHGRDSEHWEQAARERDEFERVALGPDTETKTAKKPLIEISGKGRMAKQEPAPAAKKKPDAKKKNAAAAEKPLAAKAIAKARSAKAGSKAADGKEA
jgi:hypothetical protein